MIEIPVTQEDIDAGIPNCMEPDACPIALAIRRHFGDSVIVAVRERDILIGRKVKYVFDETLLRFDWAVCDAFDAMDLCDDTPPATTARPGVIWLDEKAMTASYEERAG